VVPEFPKKHELIA